VLITGAAGQLGTVITARAGAAGHEVVAFARRDLDVGRHGAVLSAVAEVQPDVVVNCAAENDVEGAEDQPARAFEVNAFAVRSLARAAGATGAALVHYSTDFVFDGRASAPYTEDDRACPQSVYAASKLAGEWFAADVPRHYVLRVESLFGGPAARSSIDRIVTALAERRAAPVFVDRVVSPSYVEDVATATLALLEREAAPGLYHCVNRGHATWFDVGREVARVLGAPADRLVPVRMSDLALKARRPAFAALSAEKLRRAGIDLPSWQDALGRYLRGRQPRGLQHPGSTSEQEAGPPGPA
jgi:dTDP-4-dehydrorhamnose reductase